MVRKIGRSVFPVVLMTLLAYGAILPNVQAAWTFQKARTFDENRKSCIEILGEIAKKFESSDSEMAKKAKKIVADDAKAKTTTEWIEPTIEFIDYSLQRYPAEKGTHEDRHDLLRLLDSFLCVSNYSRGKVAPPTDAEKKAWADAANQFRVTRLVQLIEDVENTTVPAGSMAVWKYNNMGIIAKTKSHTFAFDLYIGLDGSSPVGFTREFTEKTAKVLDALFISHSHGDHLDTMIMREMEKLKKPVYVAENNTGSSHTLLWSTDGKFINYKGLEIMRIPGHQGALRNAITVVRSEGITIAHEGDNTDRGAYDKLANAGKIDIVVGQVHFYYKLFTEKANALASNKPRELFFLSSHEQEMGHDVETRIPFHNFSSPEMVGNPAFVMIYGEGIFYPSGKSIRPATSPKKRSTVRKPSNAAKPKRTLTTKKKK